MIKEFQNKGSSRDNALKFIGKFLGWYQNSFGNSDVANHINLLEIVKEAESIHVQHIKELDEEYKSKVISNYNDKPTKTLKKQVKKLARHSKRP